MPPFPLHIICATSTIGDGNMDFRFGEHTEVLANRHRFVTTLGLTYENCVVMRSLHRDKVVVVEKNTQYEVAESAHESLEADVLITQQPNVPLLLTTADCLPITFYDSTTHTIALAHLSRHTFVLGLIEKTLGLLNEKFNIPSEHLLVNIGPHIHKASYRFPLPLQHQEPTLTPFITEDNTHAYIDLEQATRATLVRNGVSEKNLTISPTDTATSPSHFSHVRSVQNHEPEGRLATVVCLTSRE